MAHTALRASQERHAQYLKRREARTLGMASLITLAVFAVQTVVLTVFARGLTLQADTVHTLSDFLVTFGAFLVVWLTIEKDSHATHKIKRWFVMFGLCVLIVGALWTGVEAFKKIASPPHLNGWWIILGGVIGGIGNFIVHLVLNKTPRHARTDTHKVVHLHVLQDLLASGVVLVSGIGSVFFDTDGLDPYLSLLVAGWILYRAYDLVQKPEHGHAHDTCHHH